MSFFKNLFLGNKDKAENMTQDEKEKEKIRLIQLIQQFLNTKQYAKIYEQCQPKLENGLINERHYDQVFGQVEKNIITYTKSLSWNPKSEKQFISLYQSLPIMNGQQISFPTKEYMKCIFQKNNILSSTFQIFQLWTQQILDNQRNMIKTEVEPLPEQMLHCFPEDIKKSLREVNQKIFESEKGRIGVEQNIRKCFEDLLTKYFSIPELSYSKEDSFEKLSQKLRQVTKEFVVKQIQLNNLQIPTLIKKCQREWEKRSIQLLPKEEKDNLCFSLQALIDNLLSQFDKLKETSEREMQRQRKDFEQVQNTLRKCKTNHDDEEKKFNERIKDMQNELLNKENEKKQKIKKIQEYEEELKNTKIEIHLLNENIVGLDKTVKSKERLIKDQENEIISLNQTNKNEVKQWVERMEKLKKDHQNQIISIEALKQKEAKEAIEKIQEENRFRIQQLQFENQKILETKGEEITSLVRELSELESKCKVLSFDKLFSHDILLYEPEYKRFLAQSLEDRYGESVSHTKLICTLDPLNKVNFHQYLDKVPCLMIIARLQNQRLVAAFSISPFVKGNKGEDSLLFSITNRKVFFLKPEGRPITYDDYYLIFGNSELRFKTGESAVFSNFAVNNGYFTPNGESVNILFGEGEKTREVPILGYQIFQVMFSKGLHLKHQLK